MQAAVPLLSLAFGLYTSSRMTKGIQDAYKQSTAQMQQTAQANLEEMPVAPTNPEEAVAANPEADTAGQQVAAAAQAAQLEYNPTSGLGITGSALGKKKTLAGV